MSGRREQAISESEKGFHCFRMLFLQTSGEPNVEAHFPLIDVPAPKQTLKYG